MKKQELYKTAQALISCSAFKSGDFVNVKYYHTDENGIDWYDCWKINGRVACYPEKHLTRLTL